MRRAVSAEDKNRRRDELLAAAKQVFAEQGYQSATVADVARAAGLSYGVVYWYFDSKEALLHALMEAEEATLRSRIAEAVASAESRDIRVVLTGAVGATFQFFDDDQASASLLFRDPSTLGADFGRHLLEIYGRFIGDLDSVVRTSQRNGLVRKAPPRLLAFSVAALVSQVALRRLTTDDGLRPDDAAELVVGLLFDGLGA
ncbi:MAG: TetR/AcrR family transcriptional regulator [Actinobacteria bacterium]|nr:TetR/AcrR family transcriptional regulator [Actinomycetota bacterium]